MTKEENNNGGLELRVIYVVHVGTDSDGLNIYHLLVSEDADNAWGECWEQPPAGNVPGKILMPDVSQYSYIKELKTEISLNLAQDNTCFSMQDCRDGIVALAYEDISSYDDYPEPFRIVIRFGDLIDDVDATLSERGLMTRFV